MTNIKEVSLYEDKVKIKFYEDSHRYKLEGEKDYLIGVTTATGVLDKSRPLLIWATRLAKDYLLEVLQSKVIEPEDIETAVNQHSVKKEEAATIGSAVHQWAEDYIKGVNPPVPDDENIRNGVLAFLRWVKANDVKFVESEKIIYSKKHGYVGTMDTIFTMGSEDHKIMHAGDFKTASGIYAEMSLQLAAYQEAYTEEHGAEFGDKYILRFDKLTGEFESKQFEASEQPKHFEGFLACLKLKQFTKEWDKIHGYYSK